MDESEVDQFQNLSVNVRLQCVRNTVRSHLTWNELGCGHYAVYGHVTEAGRVGEPVVEFVDELKKFLTLLRFQMCDFRLLDANTGQITTHTRRCGCYNITKIDVRLINDRTPVHTSYKVSHFVGVQMSNAIYTQIY